ncbi:hypothetical protein AB0M36_28995 [Actinoplanes sp. NPDC051346]|uniref:ElyC/SanA/YdcF family protein n=1 Tax=Actinoplanes sp. NPDC051346 TaxID=3155048 RepID=UPI00341AC819
MGIPRVVDLAEVDEAGAGRLLDVMEMLLGILSMASWPHGPADAIAVPPGQGEEWRLTHAIGLWESGNAARHLLVANGNPAERTYVPITPEYLYRLGLRRRAGVQLQGEPAPNTGLQAAWIARQVNSLGATSLLLAVTPYHLPRAYLTVLKALSTAGTRIPILPCPVPVAPEAATPETGVGHHELLPGEAHRILHYAALGWVATLEEFRDYQDWLWHHCQSEAR